MQKFELGQVVSTPGALEAFERASVDRPILTSSSLMAEFLTRHRRGDWGELGPEDTKVQNDSLNGEPERLMSVYRLSDNTKIWIITEWDRSVTTILLPEEY